MKIRVMADYGCWPLWWDGDGAVGNIAPSGLGLSESLLAALLAWAASFDATLNREDPARSGFASREDWQRFHAEGARLAARLAEELGQRASVRYQGPAPHPDPA